MINEVQSANRSKQGDKIHHAEQNPRQHVDKGQHILAFFTQRRKRPGEQNRYDKHLQRIAAGESAKQRIGYHVHDEVAERSHLRMIDLLLHGADIRTYL